MFTMLAASTMVAAGTFRTGVNAQAPTSAAAKESARAKVFEEMRQTAGAFKAFSMEGATRKPIALAREPLHRWNDPTGEISDGSLWAWKSAGRPSAILTIEFHLIQPGTWSLEFVSLSTGRVEVSDDHTRWSPHDAGVSFREIPGAPAPAVGEAERLRQMKEILKRFSASEFWDVTRQHYALRLLPHPIDRYADADSGLVDGAIFMFAKGTNPEVVVLIEARRGADGATKWSYAAATVTTAGPTLRLDGKDVWTSPNKYGYLSNESYFFLERPRALSARLPATQPAQ
jgi:hypothetical protein